MIYKRCSGLMVRSYSFFHEWLENLKTFITSNNEQFEEKCHILLLFRMLFVAKQAHVRKIIVDLFQRKKKKITYCIQKYILLFVKYVSQYTMRLIRQLTRDFGKR